MKIDETKIYLEEFFNEIEEISLLKTDLESFIFENEKGEFDDHFTNRVFQFFLLKEKFKTIKKELNATQKFIEDDQNKDLKDVALLEMEILKEEEDKFLKKVFNFIIYDSQKVENLLFEIRDATGGEESAILVKQFCKVYKKYFLKKKFKFETLKSIKTELGFSLLQLSVKGKNAFNLLKNEAGVHRIQRVPPLTEKRGRIQTSVITISVLQQKGSTEKVMIDERYLRKETFRASGAGGQHVNTTDSAVRLTYAHPELNTEIVVTSQNERSQYQNMKNALKTLSERLNNFHSLQEKRELNQQRKQDVGWGFRSEKIRTYNFPNNIIKDHRFNITTKLDKVFNKDNFDELIYPIIFLTFKKETLNFLKELKKTTFRQKKY